MPSSYCQPVVELIISAVVGGAGTQVGRLERCLQL
jgi:hypothetical protein